MVLFLRGFGEECGDFGFEVVSFPFLDGGVSRSASCGVCVSRLICFAGVSGCDADF